jgi:ribosomal protein L11 methyltransferase
MPGDTASEEQAGDTVQRRRLSQMVAEADHRWTVSALEAEASRRLHLPRKIVRRLIRRLVSEGELAYTCEHGCTFLEPSFQRPVRIGNRIVLVPYGQSDAGDPMMIPVYLQAGAAFGSGQHPTTRLALRGIEWAIARFSLASLPQQGEPHVLDVGTGSGVLLIAALALGMSSGVGLDTDPCARFEARANLRCNHLRSRATIAGGGLRQLGERRFSLIAANLRYPTLSQLAVELFEKTRLGGAVVLSGVRSAETEDLRGGYAAAGFVPCWESVEKGWVGLVFEKPGVGG